jgi:hypothetical protein
MIAQLALNNNNHSVNYIFTANHLVACEYGGMYCRASNLGSVLKRSSKKK